MNGPTNSQWSLYNWAVIAIGNKISFALIISLLSWQNRFMLFSLFSFYYRKLFRISWWNVLNIERFWSKRLIFFHWLTIIFLRINTFLSKAFSHENIKCCCSFVHFIILYIFSEALIAYLFHFIKNLWVYLYLLIWK
jgi:hypothetical protein